LENNVEDIGKKSLNGVLCVLRVLYVCVWRERERERERKRERDFETVTKRE
jgi:hypothetical protein